MANVSVSGGTEQKPTKPNILFIAIDDLNDWTDMLEGNAQARTPHMDTLASKGIVFTNAHCAAPCCGPSRSAIMSGIRPSTSGNYINKNSLTHNQILNNAVLLPEFFQQHGYYVSGAGKLFHGYHFNFEVKGRGFDEYYPSKTQDLPSFKGLKFPSKLPLGGWSRTADWGALRPDVTVDDHPDGKTANWVKGELLEGQLQEPFFSALASLNLICRITHRRSTLINSPWRTSSFRMVSLREISMTCQLPMPRWPTIRGSKEFVKWANGSPQFRRT